MSGLHGKATCGDLYGGSDNAVITMRLEGLANGSATAGGGSGKFQTVTDTFEFNAPKGFHIVGFFGKLFIKAGHNDLINSLGVLFAPIPPKTAAEPKG